MKTQEVLKYILQYPENELIDANKLFDVIVRDFPIERRIFNVQIARMANAGIIQRFKRGFYYRGVKTPFGMTKPNLYKILNERYIGDKKEVVGFFGGNTLLNQLGMTDQEANRITIYTRRGKIEPWTEKMNVEFRKAPIDLDAKNVEYFKILYLVKDINNIPVVAKNDFYKDIANHIKRKKLDMAELFTIAGEHRMNALLPFLAKVNKEIAH